MCLSEPFVGVVCDCVFFFVWLGVVGCVCVRLCFGVFACVRVCGLCAFLRVSV